MNPWNIVIIALLAVAVAAAVRACVRARKRGGMCAGCSARGTCTGRPDGNCRKSM